MKKRNILLGTLLMLALAASSATAQTAAKPAPAKAPAASSATTSSSDSAKLDINTASKEDLMKLSGVGDVIAAKIIAGRPYRTKRDLLTRKIVNQNTYNTISDKIIAHAATNAAAKKP